MGIPAVIGAALIGAVGSVATAVITKPSTPKAVAQQPQAQPKPIYAQPTAQPRTAALVRDAVYSRVGTRANQRTGSRGAEAGSSGGKSKLGA